MHKPLLNITLAILALLSHHSIAASLEKKPSDLEFVKNLDVQDDSLINKSLSACYFYSEPLKDIKLIGLISDNSKSWAIFSDPSCNFQKLTAGDCMSQSHQYLYKIQSHSIFLKNNQDQENIVMSIV